MATRVALILDESGSMGWNIQATLDGFNEYVGGLRTDVEGDYYLTVTKFSTGQPVVLYANKALAQVQPLTKADYSPGGGTALYDGIAYATKALEAAVTDDDEAVVVVITDGAENSSRETTKQQVLDLIDAKEKKGNWTFVYVGSDLTTFADAGNVGVSVGNRLQYDNTSYAATMDTYSNLSSSTRGLSKMARRGGQKMSETFTSLVDPDDEKK